jgi:ribosomal protein S18 acetylase RimI-like enzyme
MNRTSLQITPPIRRVTHADLPVLTRTLARAYHDDPVAVWACKGDVLRLAMLEGLYRVRLRQALVHREIWATSELSSVAVWVPPPGRWNTTMRQDLAVARACLHPRLMARLPLLAVGLSSVQRKHPLEPPHWYLSLLGTDPGARGHGLGSAVLQPVLERCDADGVGVYLESSKERNIDFYARFGFCVTGELRLPRGPTMWPMWREPLTQR